MTYSDDTLRQFLDGVLDQAKTKEIETAMLSDADLERRIMGLDDLAASVKAVMESLPSEARMAELAPAVSAPPTRQSRPWAMLAAACAVGVIIGIGSTSRRVKLRRKLVAPLLRLVRTCPLRNLQRMMDWNFAARRFWALKAHLWRRSYLPIHPALP
jgi:hypothetical protein